MNVRQMVPRKFVDAQDLRDLFGDRPTALTIERVARDTRRARLGDERKPLYALIVEELKKPIKLPPIPLIQIANCLKTEETGEWVGELIAARAVEVEVGGVMRWVVNFYDAGRLEPVLPPKTDISGFGEWHVTEQQRLTSRLRPTRTAPNVDDAPIGDAAAALIIVALRERGLEWENLVAHLRGKALGMLVVGLEPGACPRPILEHARAFIATHPITSRFTDRQAEADRIVSGWSPPPASEVGVKPPAASVGVSADDIPF